MSVTLSSPAVRLSAFDIADDALLSAVDAALGNDSAEPASPRSQAPVIDVVEEWGLASFPASDPPSNW